MVDLCKAKRVKMKHLRMELRGRNLHRPLRAHWQIQLQSGHKVNTCDWWKLPYYTSSIKYLSHVVISLEGRDPIYRLEWLKRTYQSRAIYCRPNNWDTLVQVYGSERHMSHQQVIKMTSEILDRNNYGTKRNSSKAEGKRKTGCHLGHLFLRHFLVLSALQNPISTSH